MVQDYQEWRRGLVKPIIKKGNKDDPENYRRIAVMDTGSKIYAKWLRKKLNKKMEEKEVLDKTQFGFRKGKETTEASLKRLNRGYKK